MAAGLAARLATRIDTEWVADGENGLMAPRSTRSSLPSIRRAVTDDALFEPRAGATGNRSRARRRKLVAARVRLLPEARPLKALIAGSVVGRRHFRNLERWESRMSRSIGLAEHAAVRRDDGCRVFHNLEAALDDRPLRDRANPTALHVRWRCAPSA